MVTSVLPRGRKVEEGLLELACRLAGEGAEVDVAHVVLQLRIIRYDGQLDGTAHQFEVERFLHARTLHRQLEAGARLSAEHLADLLVVLPGQVLSVDGHQDVARLQSGLGSRHAFVGLADHGALQLRVPGDDGTDAAIRVLEHLLQLALVVLGVIGRIGVERVEHGIDALADGLVGIDGIDIEHVQLLHNRAEDVDVLGQPEAAVVTVLEAHECRAGHHQQQQYQSRCSDLRTNPAADVVSVQSPRINKGVFKHTFKGESQRDGKPDHHRGTPHEPVTDAELVGFHQLHAGHHQENDDAVSRYAEAVVDKELCQLGSPRSCVVLNPVAGLQQFRRVGMRQDALVVSSGEKEGTEGQQHVHSEDDTQQSDNE